MSDMAGLAGQAASAGDSVLLGDLVYSQLVNQIFTGKLRPGSPLSVPAIAAQLQVSRSPVRDSVQRLIAEGLAVHVPHAGARVAQVDSETIAQVMAVRRILDEYAAREAAERASETEVVSLAALLERHADQLVSDPDPLTDARLDLEFHTAVRDLAGSPPQPGDRPARAPPDRRSNRGRRRR